MPMRAARIDWRSTHGDVARLLGQTRQNIGGRHDDLQNGTRTCLPQRRAHGTGVQLLSALRHAFSCARRVADHHALLGDKPTNRVCGFEFRLIRSKVKSTVPYLLAYHSGTISQIYTLQTHCAANNREPRRCTVCVVCGAAAAGTPKRDTHQARSRVRRGFGSAHNELLSSVRLSPRLGLGH